MTPLLLAAMLAAAPAELVPPSPPPAAASGASGSIDPAAATRAYLDELPPDQRARSDAYFEGGYWLHLWTFLWAAAIFVVLLHTGLSAKMRDLAVRATRIRALQTALYWTQFVIAVADKAGRNPLELIPYVMAAVLRIPDAADRHSASAPRMQDNLLILDMILAAAPKRERVEAQLYRFLQSPQVAERADDDLTLVLAVQDGVR